MEVNDVFKMLKGKNLQSKILYPVRLSFRTEGEIEFLRQAKTKTEFINTKPNLASVKGSSLSEKEKDTTRNIK